jgi:hypothetical protein
MCFTFIACSITVTMFSAFLIGREEIPHKSAHHWLGESHKKDQPAINADARAIITDIVENRISKTPSVLHTVLMAASDTKVQATAVTSAAAGTAINSSDIPDEGFATCSSFNASSIGDIVCVLERGGTARACFFLEPMQAADAVVGGGCAPADESAARCDGGRHFCQVDYLGAAAETGGRRWTAPVLRAGFARPEAYFVLNLPSSSSRLDHMRAQFDSLHLPTL